MNNPVATRTRLKRAPAPVRLHPALETALKHKRRRASGTEGLWPAVFLVVASVYVAYAAEFTDEAWPLAVLLAMPVIALLMAWWMQRRTEPLTPRRPARELVDRRPVLLRAALIIPQGRAPRIIRRIPPKIAYFPVRRRPHRPPRIRGTRQLPGPA